jgi:hypothetical protein
MEPNMLQDLIRAYADAYTVAITSSRNERHYEDAQPREPLAETPTKTQRGGLWRGLFSAFL